MLRHSTLCCRLNKNIVPVQMAVRDDFVQAKHGTEAIANYQDLQAHSPGQYTHDIQQRTRRGT